MWSLGRLITIVILVMGGLALISAVAPLSDIELRYCVAISGLALLGLGGWQLSRPSIMLERRYTLLRTEVEQFLGLTRQLHQLSRATRDGPSTIYQPAFDEIKASMQVSVERMVAIAHVADR